MPYNRLRTKMKNKKRTQEQVQHSALHAVLTRIARAHRASASRGGYPTLAGGTFAIVITTSKTKTEKSGAFHEEVHVAKAKQTKLQQYRHFIPRHNTKLGLNQPKRLRCEK